VSKKDSQEKLRAAPAGQAARGDPTRALPEQGGTIEILTAASLSRPSSTPANAKAAFAGDPGWLVHGFSTRLGGVSSEYGGQALNLAPTREDTPENVEENRLLFLRRLLSQQAQPARKGRQPGSMEPQGLWPLVTLKQIHSAIIHHVERRPEQPRRGDGLITRTPGILLAVQVADCLPVLLADAEHGAVGIFHAGWRGTLQRIVEKGVGEMRRRFGSAPERLQAAIGPGIGACCYEVGEEVKREFESQFAYARELFTEAFDSRSLEARYPLLFMNQRAPGHGDPAVKPHLDLAKANLLQLRDAGVPEENVFQLGLCTSCRTDLFFSYRKERVTGRMLAVVGIRS